MAPRRKKSTARQPRPWLSPPRTMVAATALRSVKLIGTDQEADIADAITSAPLRATRKGPAQLTLEIADPDHVLAEAYGLFEANDDLFLDAHVDVLVGAIWWRLQGIEQSERALTLAFVDRAGERLARRSSPMTAQRGRVTRVGFVQRMYRQSNVPLYAPELLDVQKIAKPSRPTEPKTSTTAQDSKGTYTAANWPASTRPKVKGALANPTQLRNIVGILDECRKQGASRRVSIAAIMAATQESSMGLATQTTGNDDTGLFQQGRPWISLTNVKNPGFCTRAFLFGGTEAKVGGTGGVPGWRQKHGSLRSAPGSLTQAIADVQQPAAQYRGAYAQWEPEATKTVDAWLQHGGGAGAAASSTRTTRAKAYKFERGSDGRRESTLTAANRLAGEVLGLNHWVFANTGVFASDEELIGAPVGLIVHREDEGVVTGPRWKQDARHSAQGAEVEVLVDRLPEPGQVAIIEDEGPASGKWLIDTVECDLAVPVDTADGGLALRARLTFARSTPLADEPAHEVTTTTKDPDEKAASQSGKLRRVGNRVYGGTKRERIVFAAKEAARLDAAGQRLRNVTGGKEDGYSQRGFFVASQGITGEKAAGARSDCSSWVIAMYYSADAGDPSGNSYRGGFTGTLYSNADRVATALPGDLAMFGAPPGYHVELIVEAGSDLAKLKTIGHGNPAVDYSTAKGAFGIYRPRVLKGDG